MNKPLKVLLLEDDAADAELIVYTLETAGFSPEPLRIETEPAFRAQIEQTWDIVISDLCLPRFDGIRALEILRESERDIPFILISGKAGEEVAVQAMKLGASDYLLKHRMTQLGPAVWQALARVQVGQERRKGEAALLQSEARLSDLAATSPGMIYTFRYTEDGRPSFPYASPAAIDVVGFAPEEINDDATAGFALIHPEDMEILNKTVEHSASTMTMWDFVFRYNHPRKGPVWIQGRSKPQLRPDGVLVWHGVLLDITERKQLEERFRQAQKMEAIGRLAGGIAHDFNNLLTVIQGNASLIAMDELPSSEIRVCAEEIEQAADRAAGLTRQLLLFSRKQTLQPTDLDLNNIVSGMTKMLLRIVGSNIALTEELAPDLPRVHGDPGMLEQVLMNLAVNSRDAMPNGGRLLIVTRAGLVEPPELTPGAEQSASLYVCLSVRDEGHGISHDDLPRIFEPFFTTKEVGKGTGLGLSTVYGVAKQHHGWVEVDSTVGAGTEFRVYLPACKSMAAPTTSPAQQSHPSMLQSPPA